jgi:hypothetical protein
MKLMRYSRKAEKSGLARLGVLVGKDLVADLRAGYARYLIEEIGNPKGRELAALFPAALHRAVSACRQRGLGSALRDVRLAQRSRQLGAAGARLERRAAVHSARGMQALRAGPRQQGGFGRPQLSGDSQDNGKAARSQRLHQSAVMRDGPGRDILKPRTTHELECETELAVVIGRRCKHVPEEKAFDVIAGYTILNDITARDIANAEKQGGTFCWAKPSIRSRRWAVARDQSRGSRPDESAHPHPMSTASCARRATRAT